MNARLILLNVLLLTACSGKGTYEMIQENNRWECHKQPPSEYEECIERSNKSYDQYEKERREL